jgi:hypothetical protein
VIELTVVACTALVVTLAGIGFLLLSHAAERRQWADERLALVDRAIAAHTGEVIALDRVRSGRVRPPRPDPVEIEGLT